MMTASLLPLFHLCLQKAFCFLIMWGPPLPDNFKTALPYLQLSLNTVAEQLHMCHVPALWFIARCHNINCVSTCSHEWLSPVTWGDRSGSYSNYFDILENISIIMWDSSFLLVPGSDENTASFCIPPPPNLLEYWRVQSICRSKANLPARGQIIFFPQ